MTKNKEKIIKAKAPMRFDVAGGYTDVSPFSDIEGGNVVNVALKKFATVEIKTRNDKKVVLHSKDMNRNETFMLDEEIDLSGSMRLLKACIMYSLPTVGMDITTFVDAPVGSGLGASASLAVALLGALRVLNGDKIDPYQLAEDALYVENELLGNINGGQDQYAAALGGINFFKFDASGVNVTPLPVTQKTIDEIEKKSLLVHSGNTRVSGQVLDKIMSDYLNGKESTTNNLRTLKKASFNIMEMLISENLVSFGGEVAVVYTAQKGLHETVETPTIKQIFEIANKTGIEGGKIAGAGGGGGVFLYSDKESIQQINEELSKAGFETFPFLLSTKGFEYQVEEHI